MRVKPSRCRERGERGGKKKPWEPLEGASHSGFRGVTPGPCLEAKRRRPGRASGEREQLARRQGGEEAGEPRVARPGWSAQGQMATGLVRQAKTAGF